MNRGHKLFVLGLFFTVMLPGCGGSDSSEEQRPPDIVITESADPADSANPLAPADPLPPDVVTFEGDYQLWADAAQATINLIDFESVVGSAENSIVGNEFSGLPGAPVLAGIDTEIFIGSPDVSQDLTPFSGVNMMYPSCAPSCEGVVTVNFASPVTAVGLYFIDVENDFASTGFSVASESGPRIAFSANQGQDVSTFLGFTRTVPFSTVYIHFSTGPSRDGSTADNLSYVLEN